MELTITNRTEDTDQALCRLIQTMGEDAIAKFAGYRMTEDILNIAGIDWSIALPNWEIVVDIPDNPTDEQRAILNALSVYSTN